MKTENEPVTTVTENDPGLVMVRWLDDVRQALEELAGDVRDVPESELGPVGVAQKMGTLTVEGDVQTIANLLDRYPGKDYRDPRTIEVQKLQEIVERQGWNLAGCDVLATGRTAQAFDENRALPALMAVRGLLDDYLVLQKAYEQTKQSAKQTREQTRVETLKEVLVLSGVEVESDDPDVLLGEIGRPGMDIDRVMQVVRQVFTSTWASFWLGDVVVEHLLAAIETSLKKSLRGGK